MARPKTDTVDYFPMYSHTSRTCDMLESKYGIAGYAFFYKLLQLLAKEDGHFYDASDPMDLEFLEQKLCGNEICVTDVLQKMSDWGKLDKELWDKKVIFYPGFTNTLEPVYKKRERPLPSKQDAANRLGITVTKTPVPVTKTRVSGTGTTKAKRLPLQVVTESTQSKVDNSKVDNSKLNKTNYDYVLIAEDERQKELEPFMDNETKDLSSSLVFILKYIIGYNLLSLDDNTDLQAVFSADEAFAESFASIYTKTQRGIDDTRKYGRIVKKALIGESKEKWALKELVDDVYAFAIREMKEILKKHSVIKEKSDAIVENEKLLKNDLAALKCYEAQSEDVRDEILKWSIAKVQRSMPGFNIKSSNPEVKRNIIREVLERGLIKWKK